jgi:hypothetical protein
VGKGCLGTASESSHGPLTQLPARRNDRRRCCKICPTAGTTYHGLNRLDAANIVFLTRVGRSPRFLAEIDRLPSSAWRTIPLDLSSRKYRTRGSINKRFLHASAPFRQFLIKDPGQDESRILFND